MRRRHYLTSIASIGTIAVAGCSSSSDGNSLELEYSIEVWNYEEVPDEIIEHPNPEGFSWVVVTFNLVSGTFDASDIIGLTQIEVSGSSHFTRGIRITAPDSTILTSEEDSYEMNEETQGEAYYRLSEDPEDPVWVVEQLENQHGSINLIEQ